jgi:hypothetical protein
MEQQKPKPFWKSKTVITAAIMLITFIADAAFQLGISDTIDSQLNSIFIVNEAGEITKMNWAALLSLASMLAMRFITKTPLRGIPGPGAQDNKKSPLARNIIEQLEEAKKRKK